MSEIQKADPAARAKILRFTLIVFLVCFTLLAWFLYSKNALVDWLYINLEFLVSNAWIVWLFILLVLSPLIVLGAYLIFLGRQIKQCKQFPTINSPVARDTKIIRGDAALKRATLFQGVGIGIILLSIIAANVFKLIFVSLFA